jgi:hypothetical protein
MVPKRTRCPPKSHEVRPYTSRQPGNLATGEEPLRDQLQAELRRGPPSPTKARGESWAPRSTRAFVAHAKACPLPAPGLRAYCRYRRRPLSVWTFLSVQRRRVRYLSAMLLTRSGAFSDLTYSFALSLTI